MLVRQFKVRWGVAVITADKSSLYLYILLPYLHQSPWTLTDGSPTETSSQSVSSIALPLVCRGLPPSSLYLNSNLYFPLLWRVQGRENDLMNTSTHSSSSSKWACPYFPTSSPSGCKGLQGRFTLALSFAFSARSLTIS